MEHIIKSPLPGKINQILVAEGKRVDVKDELFIIESMKMEIPVVTPVAGTINQIQVDEGQSVETGVILATLSVSSLKGD